MTREIKFRAWDKSEREMLAWGSVLYDPDDWLIELLEGKTDDVLMQYTGLKDKNGLQCIYEGDIIGEDGLIKGNIYEMDKEETDIVIQDFGGETWCKTYNEAISRGCRHSKQYAN